MAGEPGASESMVAGRLAALAHLPAAVVLFRPEGELVYSNLRAREILVELAGKVPVRLDEALG
ncbi:MAG: hypothetical protein GY723_21260, partial [bacterium]|nr:hypothetical protein [bacterium]